MLKTKSFEERVMGNPIEEVMKTHDYELFEIMGTNRDIDWQKVSDIANNFDDAISKATPIIVNEKYEIIDGQHRYHVCEQLGKPIYFMKFKGLDVTHSIEMNKRKSDWITLDFVKSFARRGHREYQYLLNFMESRKISIKSALLLSNRNCGGVYEKIRNGNYSNDKKHIGERNYRQIKQFKPYFQHWEQAFFIGAFTRVNRHENYDHEYMIEKMEFCRDLLYRTNNIKNYTEMLVNIYNRKLRTKNRIKL